MCFFVCLFTYLTTSMNTYYVPCIVLEVLHALSHFLESSIPSLPLVPELYVVIPYFMDTFSRTMKTTAHMNCLDTMIKRLNILKHRDMQYIPNSQ